ncbi:MAPEG family protein [Alphaproteobacteria bacterium GH1-50]|uniref:Microsomal glutathione S-transferase 1 n=1 Tax=Kangsaoukella pontilimi TaxID=2691042 RepID=A0A7C9IFZ7_9RHOB|nr:MAPEG family protein [Kangsaoukella pontilimi]MXQ07689.1 MAPEG family protein [Kangsaoukella pontilimi]
MLYTLENPVFWHYAAAASVMVLKLMGQGWMTVHAMLSERAGWASPEDLKKTPLNPNPDPAQLDPNPRVERSRRMHLNDLENIPAFWVAGALFVATDPPLWATLIGFWGFVLARAGHFWAYATAQIHDIRASFYTVGSLLVMVMAVWSLSALLLG